MSGERKSEREERCSCSLHAIATREERVRVSERRRQSEREQARESERESEREDRKCVCEAAIISLIALITRITLIP